MSDELDHATKCKNAYTERMARLARIDAQVRTYSKVAAVVAALIVIVLVIL